jgi:hypothetical protein
LSDCPSNTSSIATPIRALIQAYKRRLSSIRWPNVANKLKTPSALLRQVECMHLTNLHIRGHS